MFDFFLARQRDISILIREFFHPPYHEKESFLVAYWVALSCEVFGVKVMRVFRGLERDPNDVWSFIRFYVSPWASILKCFFFS